MANNKYSTCHYIAVSKRIVQCPKGHEVATEKEKGETAKCFKCNGLRFTVK